MAVAAVLVSGGLVLAGCGGSDSDGGNKASGTSPGVFSSAYRAHEMLSAQRAAIGERQDARARALVDGAASA